MHNVTHYQTQRHPVAAFLILLVFGPYLLAAALLVTVFYVIGAVLAYLASLGRR